MRTFVEVLIIILMWVGILGTLFMIAVGASNDPIAYEPVFMYVSIATIASLGIICIYLWVESR